MRNNGEMKNSISNRKVHCCVILLIFFILMFLSFPLLVIYLNNTQVEDETSRITPLTINQQQQQGINMSDDGADHWQQREKTTQIELNKTKQNNNIFDDPKLKDVPKDSSNANANGDSDSIKKNNNNNKNDELDNNHHNGGIEREFSSIANVGQTTNDHKSVNTNKNIMDDNKNDQDQQQSIWIYNETSNGEQTTNEKHWFDSSSGGKNSKLITTISQANTTMVAFAPDISSTFIVNSNGSNTFNGISLAPHHSHHYPSSPSTVTPPNISNSSDTTIECEPNNSSPSNTLNQISIGIMHTNTEGTCPRGKFSCGQGTNICLDQIKNCNGIADCFSGQDEKNCVDFSGTVNGFYNKWAVFKKAHPNNCNSTSVAPPMKPRNCSLELFNRDECPCDLTDPHVMICENKHLKEIPKNLSSTVVKIRLGLNQIEIIDYLDNPESLISLNLMSNKIKTIKPNAFEKAERLSKLYLNHNELTHLDPQAFVGLRSLTTLQIESNRLVSFDPRWLKYSPMLAQLHLDNNFIKLPDDATFQGFRRLSWLFLANNSITHISKQMLSGMESLSWLSLNNNKITHIEQGSFENTIRLEEFDLSHNLINNFQRNMFPGNGSPVANLRLGFNPITSLPKDVFTDMTLLESLHLDDGLSSAKHLLVFPVLRFAVWIVALVCCCGNIVVLIWRHISQRENKIVSIFIKNLSAADLMMGVYLCAIGWHDLEFRDEYNKRAVTWMSSWPCTAIGFLAMLSSELSVLILTLITIERYRSIASSYYNEMESRARIYIIFVWLFSFLIASYPIAHWSTTGDNVYYASNGLCLPLHIDQPFTSGWQYSAFIFLGINFSAVMIIIILYIRMYIVIRQDRRFARPVLIGKKREDAILAARFFFIVVTDCMCWIPIVVIKIMALAEVPISSTVYAWLVVFILPINSALNPIVYTLAAPTELREIVCRLLDGVCFRFDLLFSSTREQKNMLNNKKRKDTSVSSATCDTLATSGIGGKLSTAGLIIIGGETSSLANSNNSTPPSQPLKHHSSHPNCLCSCHGLFGQFPANLSAIPDQESPTPPNECKQQLQPPPNQQRVITTSQHHHITVDVITHQDHDNNDHHHHLQTYPYNYCCGGDRDGDCHNENVAFLTTKPQQNNIPALVFIQNNPNKSHHTTTTTTSTIATTAQRASLHCWKKQHNESDLSNQYIDPNAQNKTHNHECLLHGTLLVNTDRVMDI